MRKLLFVALLGCVLTFPGKVEASTSTSTMLVEDSQISQELVEKILRKVEQEYGYDYDCLCAQYKAGEVLIDKVPEGYRVEIADGGAGILILIQEI